MEDNKPKINPNGNIVKCKTMIPQEKAKEIIEKFKSFVDTDKCGSTGLVYDRNVMIYNSKQCALIAVEEILMNDMINRSNWQVAYWQEVKQEIEKL